jgi:hypothetical protein
MDNISVFLSVLATAIDNVDTVCHEKQSDYWDTLGAILKDRNFIEMIVAEMIDPDVRWQSAIEIMLRKSDRKIMKLPNRDIAEYSIELKGACKYLLDRYGSIEVR